MTLKVYFIVPLYEQILKSHILILKLILAQPLTQIFKQYC